MIRKRFLVIALFLFLISQSCVEAYSFEDPPPTKPEKKPPKLEKVERSPGLGYFRKNGFKDFFEPRVAFIKRRERHSEVVEYAWRPMVLHDMPAKERIDLVRFSINRYYFSGPEKKIFYGGGLGGNIILFNNALKDWGKLHSLSLKDGVNGLGRVFVGMKFSEFRFGKTTYPVVFRADAFFSPPYRFGGNVGKAGEELMLTEITAGISFSIE